MTDRDAYQDEMGLPHPRDADEVEFASLVEDIRAAYVRPSDPAVEARHLAAIVEHARAVPLDAAGRPERERKAVSKPLAVIVKLGLAAAAVGLLSGGLALAGVDLPILPERASDSARDAIARAAGKDGRAVDSDVQGSDAPSENPLSVRGTIDSNLPLLHDGEISGCEFGAMVSAAARDVEPDTSRCDKDDDGSKRPADAGAPAKGKARADTAKAAGAANGEEASGGKANAGGKDADKGDKSKSSAAGEESAAGKEKAEAAKSSGQAKGEEASGGKANAGGKPTG